MIHLLKYRNKRKIGKWLGDEIANELKKKVNKNEIDGIIVMPLNKKKLKLRGYNQCELIGKNVSKQLDVPMYNGLLIRTKHSKSQTNKKRYERWGKDAFNFKIKKSKIIANKTIVLLDDIITTGATISRVIDELNKIDGISIIVVSVALA